jgi:hypothetical protein
VIVKKLKQIQQQKNHPTFFKDLSLMLAMFFLPFGYDALFKLIMDLSGSYWIADIVFYSISASFFTCYFYLKHKEEKQKK